MVDFVRWLNGTVWHEMGLFYGDSEIDLCVT
jgi:hypothetical protein